MSRYRPTVLDEIYKVQQEAQSEDYVPEPSKEEYKGKRKPKHKKKDYFRKDHYLDDEKWN